jgi:hypothetical protein
MQQFTLKMSHALIPAIIAILAAGPALADKPSWKSNGKADKHQRQEKQHHDSDYNDRSFHAKDAEDFKELRYFDDRHRTIVHDYYAEQFRSGRCPPGLAKKNNGCLPPGQAKKWAVGRPLPRNVIYYDLPPSIAMQMGLPMPGYRYARVGTDILLIAIGTGMVVDAIMDLNRY